MDMDGYRYWVERKKLLIALEAEKAEIAALPEGERDARTIAAELAFRQKLDAIYGRARQEFESGPPGQSASASST
jgi:hypothetical protein